MLSICIPVHNFEVARLVQSLSDEAVHLAIPFEIVVIDDASETSFREVNAAIAAIAGVKYIELEQNIGRSQIRNLLAEKAIYDYLLFIDCDAKVPQTGFVAEYIKHLAENAVLVGGVAYEAKKPAQNMLFRWRYGHSRECPDIKIRQKMPFASFKTFNFLIPKSVFAIVQFNSKITGYGHEDTFFGIALKNAGIKIIHINNPLYHLGIETNKVFLEKTNNALQNLFNLWHAQQTTTEFINSTKVLKIFNVLPDFLKIATALKAYFLLPLIVFMIHKGRCPMFFFDIYKLTYLCKLYYNKKQHA